MAGFGGVVSFEIEGDRETTGRFIDRLRLPYIGPTLGGTESVIQQPAIFFSLVPEERQAADGDAGKEELAYGFIGNDAVNDHVGAGRYHDAKCSTGCECPSC
jgi:O-acetylhomoserine/O-acetylserine sulfhydrylase-like pyridoxal-dependent enzyme